MASAYSVRRDEIVETVAPKLTGASFRKRGGRFLREVAAGVVQVVEFPMAPSWTADYGHFGIGVGIYLPDAAAFYGQPVTLSPGIPDCEVREPFGELGPLCHDVDWSLRTDDTSLVADRVAERLERAVLPYLATYSSRRALCDAYVSGRDPAFSPRGALTVAVLFASEGEVQTARSIVAEYRARDRTPAQRAWLEERLASSSLPLR